MNKKANFLRSRTPYGISTRIRGHLAKPLSWRTFRTLFFIFIPGLEGLLSCGSVEKALGGWHCTLKEEVSFYLFSFEEGHFEACDGQIKGCVLVASVTYRCVLSELCCFIRDGCLLPLVDANIAVKSCVFHQVPGLCSVTVWVLPNPQLHVALAACPPPPGCPCTAPERERLLGGLWAGLWEQGFGETVAQVAKIMPEDDVLN